MSVSRGWWGLVLSLVVGAGAVTRAQAPKEPEAKPAADKADKPEVPPIATSVTHGRVTIGGAVVAYTATAATIDLLNDKNELTGRMFYVAYVRDGVTDPKTRPVTFVFNGGPGSSSLWLHMGSFGPRRVDTSDAQPTPPPPYTVVDNQESLLDRTDLVFVDAMGTGFSRIAGKGEAKDFYGTDPDVAAFGQFIERYVSAAHRWNSPKYLLGESYGTTRAAMLLSALGRKGMAFNGAILISSYLNAYDDFNGPPYANDMAYALYLPTMAATAWYHGRLDPKPPDLGAFLTEVRAYALGEYAHALARGSHLPDAERDAVVARLHTLTSMPDALIRNARLRITPDRFEKELLRGQQRTVGRLDARFTGIDHDAAGESPEFDAADAAFASAFTAAFNAYARDDLKVETGEIYKPTNYGEVGRDWDDKHRVAGGRWPMPDAAEDLREAMSKNPHLRVFSANGYFDFATPFFETEYTIAHMGLDSSLESNISWGYYPSGHMIYLNPASRRQLKQDLDGFYDGGN